MKLQVVWADIVEIPSDALIYSTNGRLALTGGVGAALLKKFGIRVQIDLQSRSLGTGRQLAEVGEIIECPVAGGPWKKVFHAVATDEVYHTDSGVVRSILRRCLKRCAATPEIRGVTCSALGSGYGDLDLKQFAAIAAEVAAEFDGSTIEALTIVTVTRGEAEILRLACDEVAVAAKTRMNVQPPLQYSEELVEMLRGLLTTLEKQGDSERHTMVQRHVELLTSVHWSVNSAGEKRRVLEGLNNDFHFRGWDDCDGIDEQLQRIRALVDRYRYNLK